MNKKKQYFIQHWMDRLGCTYDQAKVLWDIRAGYMRMKLAGGAS